MTGEQAAKLAQAVKGALAACTNIHSITVYPMGYTDSVVIRVTANSAAAEAQSREPFYFKAVELG